MNRIQVLDQITIDKIAAGEVIERPSSVVKELVENAIDAGSTAITVEITDGGSTLIRIADNGCGIDKEEVPRAFLRHSTSKIRSVEDLIQVKSLGFRGEALSSIAAVSQVELITKTKEETFGVKYCISGGKEEGMEETGASTGTTFFVRQLFYNTPARRKFLKTPMTEASHVGELMTRLALSHPDISFRFINNGQTKLHTSGNGNLKDVIYHIYGREITANLLDVDYKANDMHIHGFIGAPLISRGNRNFENYFINGRYIKSSIIFKAIEDAYKDFTMQHKYPFVVLSIEIGGEHVDVNVHPTKMELRFNNQQEVYNTIYEAIDRRLHEKELIPEVTLEVKPEVPRTEMLKPEVSRTEMPKPEVSRTEPVKQAIPDKDDRDLNYFMEAMKKRVTSYHAQDSSAEVADRTDVFRGERQADRIKEAAAYRVHKEKSVPEDRPQQLDLFEEKLLDKETHAEYKVIGQVFDTYWLVEFHENLYIIDQHAAHERVLYEKTLKGMKTREFTSQMISPPIILNLSMQEKELLETYMDQFTRIGFEFEEFGQEAYAVRAVPDNLFGIAKKELLLQMIDSLSEDISRRQPTALIDERVASMSCKAAVKGNMKLSFAEVDALIGELLVLENPYHCPHGRPTIISMSKRELEKKFKRIVS